MNRLATLIAGVFVVAGLVVAVGAAASKDEVLKDSQHFLEQSQKTFQGGARAGSALNIEVVGHTDLGGRGFNADVWYHDGYAYVGQWGFADWATGNNRFCPSGDRRGVAVVDVTPPETPMQVATLLNPEGTSAEDVVVYTAEGGPLDGHDIAVAAIQWCGGSRYAEEAVGGLMLWDVTDASNPVQLGFLDTECCTRGVHEFEIERHVNGHTYAYATVPTSRYPDGETGSGYRDENGEGDFRLIDITDPRSPLQVSSWGIQDIDGPFTAGQGCDADTNYGHGAEPSEDGTLVFLSYWDSGFIRLDVSDPSNPVFTGRTQYASDEDGDAHSSQYDEARQLLITADEDFCKTSGAGTEKSFGYMRIYDYSNPAAPVQIGEYRTPNSLGPSDQGAGDYVIHNNYLVGTDVYASWYSDGVRVIDTSDPTHPVEVAYFVPPATQNPVKPSQRGVLTNTAQVWGVVVDETTGLIYASDMNSGLWILRRTG